MGFFSLELLMLGYLRTQSFSFYLITYAPFTFFSHVCASDSQTSIYNASFFYYYYIMVVTTQYIASFLKPQFIFPNVHLTFPLRWLTDIQNLICPKLDSYPSSSKLIYPVLPISTDVQPFLPGFQARNLTVNFNLFCIPNQPLPTPQKQKSFWLCLRSLRRI